MSVSKSIIQGINVHNIIRERYYFSSICIFKKAIKNVEIKVDVQKWALRFRIFLDSRCVSTIQSHYPL